MMMMMTIRMFRKAYIKKEKINFLIAAVVGPGTLKIKRGLALGWHAKRKWMKVYQSLPRALGSTPLFPMSSEGNGASRRPE